MAQNGADRPKANPQPGFVGRFHVLVLLFTVALGVVGVVRGAEGGVVPLHWGSSAPDIVAPAELAFAAMPLLALIAMAGFFITGRLLTPFQREGVRHLLEPALTAFVALLAVIQLGLMMVALDSEIDLIRIAGFGLVLPLLLLGVLFPEAERNSYAGLRLPWAIASDRVWRRAHRAAGVAFGLAALGLGATAWLWPAPVTLVPAMLGAVLLPPVLALIFSTDFSSRAMRRQ